MAEKTHRKKQSGTKAQKRKKAVNKKKGVDDKVSLVLPGSHWRRLGGTR